MLNFSKAFTRMHILNCVVPTSTVDKLEANVLKVIRDFESPEEANSRYIVKTTVVIVSGLILSLLHKHCRKKNSFDLIHIVIQTLKLL